MKATKKLLLIGLALAVLMGLASVFAIGAAATFDTSLIGNAIVIEDIIVNETKVGSAVNVNVQKTVENLDDAGFTVDGTKKLSEFADVEITLENAGTALVYEGVTGAYVATAVGTYEVALEGVTATVVADGATVATYDFPTGAANATVNVVEPAKIAVTLDAADFVVDAKEYDGTTNATVTYVGNALPAGTTIYVSATFNSANVLEANTVTVNVAFDTASAAVYELTETTFTVDAADKITPRRVNVSGIKFVNKVYDGTKNVTLSGYETITIANVLNGEHLTVNVFNTSAASANVGRDVEVKYDYELVSADAGTLASNYEIDDHSKVRCSIEISPLKVTVLVDDVTYAYGDAPEVYTYTTKQTITDEARAALDTVIVITSEYTGTSTVGTYAIVATVDETSANAENFEITVIDAVAIVEAKQIYATVTIPTTFVYGTATDSLEIVVTDEKGNAVTVADGVLSVVANVEGILPVGTYTVDVVLNDAENYVLTSTEQTLTVVKKTLTVKVEPTTVTYGDINPTYVITVEGFVNGETAAIIPEYSWNNISVTTEYKQGSAVGTYEYIRTGNFYNLANYEFDYSAIDDGALTVNAKKITVAAKPITVVYGQDIDEADFISVADQLYGTDTFDASRVTFEAWLVNADGKVSIRALNGNVTAHLADGYSYAIYPVVADVAGTENYTYEVVPAILTVNKLIINVSTLDTIETVFNTLPENPAVPFAGFEKLPESDRANVVITYYSNLENKTVYVAGDHVGEYAYTVTLATASVNYEINLAEGLVGKLVVKKATLKVTVDNLTNTYGDTATFTYTQEALPAGIELTLAGGTYTVKSGETTVTARYAAGTYTVVLSGLTLDGANKGDYDIEYVAGTFTVTKKTLNVAVSIANTAYGSDADLTPPTFPQRASSLTETLGMLSSPSSAPSPLPPLT